MGAPLDELAGGAPIDGESPGPTSDGPPDGENCQPEQLEAAAVPSCTLLARLPADGQLAGLDPLDVDPDWRSYQWMAGTTRWRRWTSETHPEVHVPVLESALCDGVLGCTIWKSSAVLAEYLVEHADAIFSDGDAVLDVGCGCGLAGATAALVATPPPRLVTFSELYPFLCSVAHTATLAALAGAGFQGSSAEEVQRGAGVQLDTLMFDWNAPTSTWGGEAHSYSVLLASDASSEKHHHELGLARTFHHFARQQGVVVVDVNPDTRTGLPEFRREMVEQHGFALAELRAVPCASEDRRVPGLTCGAETFLVDVYRR